MRQNWQMWSGGIDEATVDRIIFSALATKSEPAKIFSDNQENAAVRRSDVKWLTNDTYLHGLLWGYVQQANRAAFGFNVHPVGDIQYTEYNAEDEGHYDWHHDIHWNQDTGFDRKLSVTVQLSDPEHYEGGDFEFSEVEMPDRAEAKKRGTVLVFPSYLTHRVSPVTKGKRVSLVAWFEGPRWR
jgi:PKHD-type hydroxylase